MAFETYQCNQYIKYLQDHKKTVVGIYKLIESSPFTFTRLGEEIGVTYHVIHKRLKRKTLTYADMVKLLEFIK